LNEDQKHDLKACWTGGVQIEQQIAAAIKEFEKGGKIHMTRAILSLKDLIKELPQEVSDCKAVGGDMVAISGWSKAISGLLLPAKIGKNIVVHHKAIFADFKVLKTDLAAKDYFKTG